MPEVDVNLEHTTLVLPLLGFTSGTFTYINTTLCNKLLTSLQVNLQLER
jgi:hypothetical protein